MYKCGFWHIENTSTAAIAKELADEVKDKYAVAKSLRSLLSDQLVERGYAILPSSIGAARKTATWAPTQHGIILAEICASVNGDIPVQSAETDTFRSDDSGSS